MKPDGSAMSYMGVMGQSITKYMKPGGTAMCAMVLRDLDPNNFHLLRMLAHFNGTLLTQLICRRYALALSLAFRHLPEGWPCQRDQPG